MCWSLMGDEAFIRWTVEGTIYWNHFTPTDYSNETFTEVEGRVMAPFQS